MCNSAAKPHPTRPTLTCAIAALLPGKVHLTAYGLARKLWAEPFGDFRDSSFASRRRCAAAALLIALIMMSAPRTAVGQAQSQPAAIAPEHQDMAAKRAKEREKINNCQKQATEQKILPRDRPQFVINCHDGTAERNQPSVVAPEYQELAAKRAKEKERIDTCQKQATEQKVLPRDRPQD